MPHEGRFTVLVVHDDPLAEAGLVALLSNQSDFEVLRGSAERLGTMEAETATGRGGIDVVVADYPHGIALGRAFKRNRRKDETPKVIIVTATDGECEIRSAIECGVGGYLLAGAPLEEIAAGIRAVLRGARKFSAGVNERLAQSLSSERLTLREGDVLELVVSGACNKAIAKELRIAVGTVKSHLKSIFEKLQVATRTQAVAAAGRRGLLRERRVPVKRSASAAQPRDFADGHIGREQRSELSA